MVAVFGLLAMLLPAVATAMVNYATVSSHVSFSVRANGPAYWGANCTKQETIKRSSYVLPQGYGEVIVKAGSGQYANTVFLNPTVGQTVWADTNGNNVFDPLGRPGDKDIDHVIFCGPTATVQTVKIGVDLSLAAGENVANVSALDGILLALAQHPVPGYDVELNVKDDVVDGAVDRSQGAANTTALVNDASVYAMVGPFGSAVAFAEIPITNAASLLQCSPSNTAPGLTKEWGGVDPTIYRPAHPDKIAYVRVVAPDDVQGPAGADIAYNVAGAKTAWVVDDTSPYGSGIADAFTAAFQKLGGTVVRRDSVDPSVTDYTSLIAPAISLNPQYVYFGGVTTTGGGELRRQMVAPGLGIPFGGPDGIWDGSAATAGSFLNVAGPEGDPSTYATTTGANEMLHAPQFVRDYHAMFSTDPSYYSASAYACTQILLQALQAVGPVREKVRAYVTKPNHTYQTVIGAFGFDRNGDTTQKLMGEFTFDPGTNDWKFFRERDYARTSQGKR